MADRAWRFEWRHGGEIRDAGFVARWEAMADAAPGRSPFMRPAVARAWLDTCGSAIGCEPMFGLASCGTATVLLPWVLIRQKGRLVTRLVIEGVGQDLFGYGDPIVGMRDGAAVDWRTFWAAVRDATAGRCHQALFRSVDARWADPAAPAAEGAPVLDLAGVKSFDALLERCSRNHRAEVRRRIRRLGDRGEVTLRVFGAGERRDAAQAVEQLVAAYVTRQERRPEYLSPGRPGLLDLWRAVATEGVDAGWGHLATLFVGGQPIAWHLGFVDRDALYWWVPAHDPAWEPYSPGKMLLAKLMEHAIARGWRALHLLAGEQPYKMAWRPAVPDRRVVRWHAPTMTGALLRHYDRHAAAV